MSPHFTLGIEEEFQLVDRISGQLSPRIEAVLSRCRPVFGEQIKPELHQSMVELISDVLPDIQAARSEMGILRGKLARLVAKDGLALISAGMHPTALWWEEPISPFERYRRLEEEYQDAIRCELIFGLHVHVCIESHEIAIAVMNQARNWLPHLLALSTNSPFWAGRLTGLKSYRSVIWRSSQRNGIPEIFPSYNDLDAYLQALMQAGCIDNGKSIWWDVRRHPFFPTLEFRICDMPATFDDMIAIAALCQALVATLYWRETHGQTTTALPACLIKENKWYAMRRGLDAEVIDFLQGRRLSMREAIAELLDFVDEVIDDLGSRHEIDYLRTLLSNPCGTGADHQIAVYQQTGSMNAVLQMLMQQALQGIPMGDALAATGLTRSRR
ncbi:MAG TPA: carboxylate-amine ligase [Ktedonobacteraceae bacterium]|nr:carboxylate-amine ligase [Ktedonobacteraceae bacterium]